VADRQYCLVAINERTDKKTVLTSSPVTLDEAHTMRSKFYPRPRGAARNVRIQVEEIDMIRWQRACYDGMIRERPNATERRLP
jgi:hypothetical protein